MIHAKLGWRELGARLRGVRVRAAAFVRGVRESVHALLVLRVLGAAFVVIVLAWIGGRSSPVPDALAQTLPTPPRTEAPTSALSVAPRSSLPDGKTDAGSGSPASSPATTCVCPDAASPRGTTHGRATPSDPVNINEADETGLRRLPGVGPKRAEAILSLRRKLGRFRRVEELLRVKGVGRATLRKWKELVRLDTPAAKLPGAEVIAPPPNAT